MDINIKMPDFSFFSEYSQNNLTLILLSLCIGIFIASIAILYRQNVLGSIIRNIVEKNALGEENALSLKDLGYKKNNFLIKFALREKSTFMKNISVTKTENGEKLYYINQDKKDFLLSRFRKKGNNITALILGIILFLTAAFICLTVIPMFIEQIKDIF